MFFKEKFEKIFRLLKLIVDNFTIMNERIALLNDKVERLTSDLEQMVLDKGRKINNNNKDN